MAFALFTQTTLVAHAEEPPVPVPVSILRPMKVDVLPRLALVPSMDALRDGRSPLSPTPSPIMSNNTKTVLIVAIVAGAVLILVGAVAIGKPFKHL